MISEHHIPSIKHHIPDILEILQQFLGLIFNCMDWFEIIFSPPILGILISNKLSMTFYIPYVRKLVLTPEKWCPPDWLTGATLASVCQHNLSYL